MTTLPKKKNIKKAAAAPSPNTLRPTANVVITMIPAENLVGDEDNPNQMDEATFDQLVEEIREQGFDEPVLVRASDTQPGKFEIGSGHHRTKAAKVLNIAEIPCIVKPWTEREKKVALSKRNALRGAPDKAKLAKLFQDLSKGRDPVQVQRELGYTDPKRFDKIVEQAKKNMTPKQRKKLDAAKEDIKSMDDLSSVLNKIFKDSGSELDEGYLVFSFGGKKHHYFQINADTEKKLQEIIKACEKSDTRYADHIQSIVAAAPLPTENKPATKKVVKKRTTKKE